MFCIMLFGRICCRYLENVITVEDVINIGGEEGSELLSSDGYF